MQTIRLIGEVDDQHRLVASVPVSVPPGSVELLLITREDGDDDAGVHWAEGISQEWHDELSDLREDICTLEEVIATTTQSLPATYPPAFAPQ
jgi:hypothetical protein